MDNQPEPADPVPRAAVVQAAVVQSVSGRGSGDKGLPPVNEMVLEGDDGTMRITRVEGTGEKRAAAVLATATYFEFPACPLCNGPLTTPTKEHVPQADLGGQKMTLTCARCNNTLGTRVEPELRDWFDDAVGSVRLSGDAIQGRRKTSRVLLRTVDGQAAYVPEYPLHPDLRPLFESGKVDMEFHVPDRTLWSIAAMKHAYLGACLLLERVPDTPLARQIRQDLVAVRDAPARDNLPPSALAGSLRVVRSMAPASAVAVSLVALIRRDGSLADVGISLAGTLFVCWPLELDLLEEVIVRAHSSTPSD